MKKETLTTISERTGFSVSTVSRVLSGSSKKCRISQETCDIIRREAEKCNYHPNIIAQVMRQNSNLVIGLLVPSLSNPFFADMAGVVVTELHRRGFIAMVIDTMEDKEIFLNGLKSMVARRIDGVIAVPCGSFSPEVEEIGRQIPMVLVDRFYPGTAIPYVTTNNYRGAMDATAKLLARGHERIVCIQGESESMPNKERIEGYMKAMENAGMADKCLIVGNSFSIQSGYVETKLLLNSTPRPTAIFALSNNIMLGAIKAIRESSLKIPADMALICFDDNPYMDYMTPSIARMAQPVHDMSCLAVKILLNRITNSSINSQIRVMPFFVNGESI